MTADVDFFEQGYEYFKLEAPDLLQQIEQELLTLATDPNVQKVHGLMRSAHTLKGAAASVGETTIQTVAHSLEDIFKLLYQPDVTLNPNLEQLIYEGVDCLRIAISGSLFDQAINEQELLNRMQGIYDELTTQIGTEADTGYIPSSAELGFDIVLSIFETGVAQRLDDLQEKLKQAEQSEAALPDLMETLATQGEVFIGLAESLNLPGFQAIAEAMTTAFTHHPDQSLTIAKWVLADLRAAQAQVLAGDRVQGGQVSPMLQALADPGQSSDPYELDPWDQVAPRSPEAVPSLEADPWGQVELEAVDLWNPMGDPSIENPEVDPWAAIPLDQELESNNEARLASLPPAATTIPLELGPLLRQWSHTIQTPNWTDLKSTVLNWCEGLMPIATQLSLKQLEQIVQSTVTAVLNYPDEMATIVELVLADLYTSQPVDLEAMGDPSELFIEQWLQDQATHSEATEVWGVPSDVVPPDAFELAVEASYPTTIDITETSQTHAIEDADPKPIEWQPGYTVSHDLANLSPTDLEALSVYLPTAAPQIPQAASNPVPQAPSSDLIRVEVEKMDQLHHHLGELLTQQNYQTTQHQSLSQTSQDLAKRLQRFRHRLYELLDWAEQHPDALPQLDAFMPLADPQDALQWETFDSIELDRYSEWTLLVQSLLDDSITLNELAETLTVQSQQAVITTDKQQRILAQTRDSLMAARLVPLSELYSRFPRMIQQLEAIRKKRVNLKFEGSEVCVDKSIVEKLYNPLLHLLRNAFDHGIESPADRRQAQKPEQGTILVRSRQHGNRLGLEVQDDGAGIHYEKIRQRAIERGLSTPEQAHQLSTHELLDLLFEPGFSTKSEADDLSGRGVGLDSVRSQLQQLQGTIRISSVVGRGTTFNLEIPLNLTIMKLLLCQVQDRSYALLTDTIVQLLLPRPEQVLMQQQGHRLLRWVQDQQDRLVPIYDLNDLLTYTYPGQTRSASPSGEDKPLILFQQDQELIAVEVDQLMGERELVIKTMTSLFPVPSYVSGCSPLGNGQLALVIDGYDLLAQTNYKTTSQPLGATHEIKPDLNFTLSMLKSPGSKGDQKILVVEDSLTVRQTLTQSLQRMGYQVVAAAHGKEALDTLARQQSDLNQVQLIFCDIEMPHMNGYQFLSHMQQDTSLSTIPVVMLTSRSSEKHQNLAFELGASAYLTKPYLDQDLKSTIEDVLSPAPVS